MPAPSERSDRGDLEGLVVGEVGQDARQPGGEHRLARSRRPDHRHVVGTCGRDGERLDHILVSQHVAHIELALGCLPTVGRHGKPHGFDRLRRESTAVPDRGIPERSDRDDPDPVHQVSLIGIRRRNHDIRESGPTRRGDRREHSRNRSEPAVESELAEVDDTRHGVDRDVAGRSKRRDGDREVEPGALLAQGRGREVDGEFALRQRASRVDGSRSDAFAGLAEGRVRQSDEHERRKAGSDVRLDFDDVSLQPVQCDGEGPRHGHQTAPRTCSTIGLGLHASRTATTSIRNSADARFCLHHSAASRRRRAALAGVIASNGCPKAVDDLVFTSAKTVVSPSLRTMSISPDRTAPVTRDHRHALLFEPRRRDLFTPSTEVVFVCHWCLRNQPRGMREMISGRAEICGRKPSSALCEGGSVTRRARVPSAARGPCRRAPRR